MILIAAVELTNEQKTIKMAKKLENEALLDEPETIALCHDKVNKFLAEHYPKGLKDKSVCISCTSNASFNSFKREKRHNNCLGKIHWT